MKSLSLPYQLMIICVAVLAVFYPTQFADISLVDDMGALSEFFSNDTVSLHGIFFPHATDGGYYRPLIGLSYLIDKKFWFLQQELMHFEGVLAHLLNGILVFFVSRAALRLHVTERMTFMPLAAALLFSLHPIVTESVNWISGRTDIMMGTFVLISTLCFLKYTGTRSKKWLIPALIFALISLLAKEAAFGFLLWIPLLWAYHPEDDSGRSSAENVPFNLILFVCYFSASLLAALLLGSYWLVLVFVFIYVIHNKLIINRAFFSELKPRALLVMSAMLCISIVSSLGLYLLLRKIAYVSSVKKIGQTVTLMLADVNYTISVFLGAAGFYVKKFFIPTPLNFFILEIDPLYDFIGIAVLLFVVYLLSQRSLPALFILLGFCLLLPALPFAFGTIAWTAYAERYIYLSSAFWVVGISVWAGKWLEHTKNKSLSTLVSSLSVLICLCIAFISFKRNITWMTNVDLMRDTVAQTPKMRKLRNIYIQALLERKRTDDALEEYRKAASVAPSPVFDEQAELMIGGQLVAEKRRMDALKLYQRGLERTNMSSEKLLVAVVSLLQQMRLDKGISPSDSVSLAKLEKNYEAALQHLTRNPHVLSTGEKLPLKRADLESAAGSFVVPPASIPPRW